MVSTERGMIMYIPEFWCGVIATILCEVAFGFVLTAIVALKEGEKDGETREEIN